MYGFSHIVCAFFIFYFLFFVVGGGGGGILGVKKIPRGEGKGRDKKFQVLCVCVGGRGRIFLSHSVCARLGKVFLLGAGAGEGQKKCIILHKELCFSYIK